MLAAQVDSVTLIKQTRTFQRLITKPALFCQQALIICFKSIFFLPHFGKVRTCLCSSQRVVDQGHKHSGRGTRLSLKARWQGWSNPGVSSKAKPTPPDPIRAALENLYLGGKVLGKQEVCEMKNADFKAGEVTGSLVPLGNATTFL